MVFDGSFRYIQSARDFIVFQSVADQSQYFDLLWRQFRAVGQPQLHLRRSVRKKMFARHRPVNDVDQRFRTDILIPEAVNPGCSGTFKVTHLDHGCDDDDLDFGKLGLDFCGSLNAVFIARSADIH